MPTPSTSRWTGHRSCRANTIEKLPGPFTLPSLVVCVRRDIDHWPRRPCAPCRPPTPSSRRRGASTPSCTTPSRPRCPTALGSPNCRTAPSDGPVGVGTLAGVQVLALGAVGGHPGARLPDLRRGVGRDAPAMAVRSARSRPAQCGLHGGQIGGRGSGVDDPGGTALPDQSRTTSSGPLDGVGHRREQGAILGPAHAYR